MTDFYKTVNVSPLDDISRISSRHKHKAIKASSPSAILNALHVAMYLCTAVQPTKDELLFMTHADEMWKRNNELILRRRNGEEVLEIDKIVFPVYYQFMPGSGRNSQIFMKGYTFDMYETSLKINVNDSQNFCYADEGFISSLYFHYLVTLQVICLRGTARVLYSHVT